MAGNDGEGVWLPATLKKNVYWVRLTPDNTMAKRKSTKGQTTIYKTYTEN